VKGTPNPPAKEDGEIHALKQKTDSNLMRLLQRALCGNSKSYMVQSNRISFLYMNPRKLIK
jgi:hypothetical protein